jgi:hypothetical protein
VRDNDECRPRRLLFSHGGRIFLFGAWPRGWDADFVLHAERGTVVEAACENGTLTRLRVTPEARRRDVVFVQSYCRPHPGGGPL